MSVNVAVQLDKYREQALRSLLAGDYAGARTTANACLLIISTIPDGSLANLSSQSWNRQGIVAFLEQLDRLEASAADSGGIYMMPVEYCGRRGVSC